jgi:hypothetical protein
MKTKISQIREKDLHDKAFQIFLKLIDPDDHMETSYYETAKKSVRIAEAFNMSFYEHIIFEELEQKTNSDDDPENAQDPVETLPW